MTLFEIMLVIGITGLITVAAILGLGTLQSSFRVRSAADEIRAQLELGRELAIANQDQASYRIGNQEGVVILYADNVELSRFIPPQGLTFSPETFEWGFTPITGELTGCTLPCSLTLSSGGSTELINIHASGVVD